MNTKSESNREGKFLHYKAAVARARHEAEKIQRERLEFLDHT